MTNLERAREKGINRRAAEEVLTFLDAYYKGLNASESLLDILQHFALYLNNAAETRAAGARDAALAEADEAVRDVIAQFEYTGCKRFIDAISALGRTTPEMVPQADPSNIGEKPVTMSSLSPLRDAVIEAAKDWTRRWTDFKLTDPEEIRVRNAVKALQSAERDHKEKL